MLILCLQANGNGAVYGLSLIADDYVVIVPSSGVYLKALEIRLLAILLKQLISVFHSISGSISN